MKVIPKIKIINFACHYIYEYKETISVFSRYKFHQLTAAQMKLNTKCVIYSSFRFK